MHVGDGFSELRPRLPAGLHHARVYQSVEHGAYRTLDHFAAALRPAGGYPQLEIRLELMSDLQRRGSGTHEVLLRPRGSKRADAQNSAAPQRAVAALEDIEVVEVRQVGARCAV